MGFYKAHGADRVRVIAVLYSGSNKTDVPAVEQRQLLDYLAAGSQTKRKASTYAEAELTLTGEPGTIVPAGTVLRQRPRMISRPLNLRQLKAAY